MIVAELVDDVPLELADPLRVLQRRPPPRVRMAPPVFEPREVLEEIVASQARGRPEFHGEGFTVKRSPGQRTPKLPEAPRVAAAPPARAPAPRRRVRAPRWLTIEELARRLERLAARLGGAA